MDQLKVVVYVIFIFSTVQGATIQVPCKNDTDCMPGQCCYHEPEFLVASRRQAALTLDIGANIVKHDTGVCENYHQEREQCYYLEKVNGHCGCAQGLTCQFDPPCVRPTDQTNRHLRGAPCPWVHGSEKCMRIK